MLLKVGIQLLAILKPIKRLGWWKGKFALFRRPATCGEGVWGVEACPKVNFCPSQQAVGRSFIGKERWLHAKSAQSAQTVILKLVMHWSDQHHLDCFKYVSLFDLLNISHFDFLNPKVKNMV